MYSLTPNFFVSNLNDTIEFYNKLGFEVVAQVPEEGANFDWVMMSCDTVVIMFQTFQSLRNDLPEIKREKGSPMLLYIKMKDIETFYKSIQPFIKIAKPLEKTFYGAKEFSIIDPNDIWITFANDGE
ncbi:MAG: hypothetical protein RLZZ546_1118 [Bacteroidota bacterium]|jgi:uncharacterized glyoxalase superfamily protein PhnB